MLRPWQLSDAEAVVRAFADPEIQRWHVRRFDSVKEGATADHGLECWLG